MVEVVGPGPPVCIGQVGESGGGEVDESPFLDGLGLGFSVGDLVEVEGRGLLNVGVWIGLVGKSGGEEVDELSFPGGLVVPGLFGLMIEIEVTGPLDEVDEVDEASVEGGLGPLGLSGRLTEIGVTGLLDDGIVWVVVSVLSGGDGPVKDTP